MKSLGIDYGKKHVGLAISDSAGTTAVAYKTIANKNLLEQLVDIQEQELIQRFVIGHSHNLNGTDNTIQSEITRFSKQLHEATNTPVEQHTEIFTSMQAKWGTEKNIRREHRDDKTKKQTGRVDAQAAAIMLQSYLDSDPLL